MSTDQTTPAPPDSETAAIRFGFGLSPRIAPPAGPGAMLDALRRPDGALRRFPVADFGTRVENARAFHRLRKAKRAGEAGAGDAFKALRHRIGDLAGRDFRRVLARAAFAEDGFRERLAFFWADHFTAATRGGKFAGAWTWYIDAAIRPNMTSNFAGLLRAVITNAVMVTYLDQHLSAGPNSRVGRRTGRGLNENLARELMELHTLGVGGAYTQDDVRQLAELLTGLSFTPERGVFFRPGAAEPGAETVLGRRYGGNGPARMSDIHKVLDDLAAHPDTARHIARKLAVHFVSDAPDAGLVAHLEQAFNESDGDLMQVYAALLEHPAAWRPERLKAKRPLGFVASALRALDPPSERITGLGRRETNIYLASPLTVMGQRMDAPPDPSGWPEEAQAWITPQGLAARLEWALTVPRVLRPRLPDPRDFLRDALGDDVPGALSFAVAGAETRWEGVGLVLASPAFNLR